MPHKTDAEFMADYMHWPHMFLPLVHRANHRLALLIPIGDGGFRVAYDVNMWDDEKINALRPDDWTEVTPAELVQRGWEVD